MTEDIQETAEEAAARWQDEVSHVYELATSSDRTFLMAGYVLVSDAVSAEIQIATGVDVSGFRHVIDTDTLRHIIKKHGQPAEAKRGQIPIVKEDFIKILRVVTEPDNVADAGSTALVSHTVLYTKLIEEEDFFFVQGIETGRKHLRPVTMYKRKRRSQK